MDDDADGEAEELVDLAHPLGVALGEVVVDGDDVDAVAGERVEIAGEGGDEGLAFAGLHFGDLALVQDHAADQLHVEVAHLDGAPAGFADDGEGLGQNLVEGGALGGFDVVGVGDALKRAAMRARNSTVLARSCSSESFSISGSRALIWATMGSSFLMTRSLAVPNTLVSALSKNTGVSIFQCKWRWLQARAWRARVTRSQIE